MCLVGASSLPKGLMIGPRVFIQLDHVKSEHNLVTQIESGVVHSLKSWAKWSEFTY